MYICGVDGRLLRGEGCDGWDGELRAVIGRVFQRAAIQCTLVAAGRGQLMRLSPQRNQRNEGMDASRLGHAVGASQRGFGSEGRGGGAAICVRCRRRLLAACWLFCWPSAGRLPPPRNTSAREETGAKTETWPRADLRDPAERSTERSLPLLPGPA